ncbi:FapA family protein [Clostridium sp. E02]|uniref:DUF342 domain-containing protein n=1 Tax=Clostridium sp. E02 TaxID=2487134 RepID=UPI0013DDE001|nr:FapA family protein [Clostridium sp. E02]
MKEKNRKGFLGLFQNVKHFKDSLKNVPSADDTNELTENQKPEAKVNTPPSKPEDTESLKPDTNHEQATPPPSLIWESCNNDPLLVRVDEELLEIEYKQFGSKMKSLSNAMKSTAASTKAGETEPDQGELDQEEPHQEQEPDPIAAQPHLYLSNDQMAAWIYVIPPINNGADIKEEDLKALLAQEHITVGIMEDELKSIVENKTYEKVVLIAKGILARNGIDGTIKDNFKRIVNLEFEEDENGSVDYKHLNNIQSVKEGEVISEISTSIPGEDGKTVTGKSYPCDIKGTNVPVPSGRNTTLTEDRTLLLSQKTGHVTFANGKFQVDPILKINGNVDNNTGNLDYDGDILIAGDVRNGFSVKATGSIDIRGSVEGAEISAQGPIVIASGVSGNGKGSLYSDAYIKCRYLEHCSVTAKGNVYAESIINSKVKSSEDIIVTAGIGVIIGGSLLATNNISAKMIGSKVRRLVTELIIANIPKDVEESTRLTRELEQLQHNLEEIRKNITYLETVQRQDKQQLLENLKQASDILAIRENEINDRLTVINEKDMEQTGIIQSQQLLPVVRIRIGSSSLMIQEEHSSCTIYKNSEGDIIIGSK